MRLLYAFDVVLTHDDTGHHKPSPVPFLMALDKLGVEPHRAVNIGDWPERDIVGGADAGLHTVYARYGDTYGSADRVKQENSGAQYEIDDLAQLLDVLDRLTPSYGGTLMRIATAAQMAAIDREPSTAACRAWSSWSARAPRWWAPSSISCRICRPSLPSR